MNLKFARIGNIEFRACNEAEGKYEIVLCFDIPYYNLNGSVSKTEVSCMTILFIDCNTNKTPEYRCVGSRPFELSEKDYKDLKTIIKLIEENYDEEV